MNLKDQIKSKLDRNKENITRAEDEHKNLCNKIKYFFISEQLNDEVNRIFALKKSEIEDIGKRVKVLAEQFKIILNYKEIVLEDELKIHKAIQILDKQNDGLSFLIAELKSISIALENRLKQQ